MSHSLIKNNIKISIIYDDKQTINENIVVKKRDQVRKYNMDNNTSIDKIIDKWILIINPIPVNSIDVKDVKDVNGSLHFIFFFPTTIDPDKRVKDFFHRLDQTLGSKLKTLLTQNSQMNDEDSDTQIQEIQKQFTDNNVIPIDTSTQRGGGYSAKNRVRRLHSEQAVKNKNNKPKNNPKYLKYYQISRKKQNKPKKHHMKTPKLRKKSNTSRKQPSNKPPSKKKRTYKQSSKIKKKKKSQTIRNYTKQTKNQTKN